MTEYDVSRTAETDLINECGDGAQLLESARKYSPLSLSERRPSTRPDDAW